MKKEEKKKGKKEGKKVKKEQKREKNKRRREKREEPRATVKGFSIASAWGTTWLSKEAPAPIFNFLSNTSSSSSWCSWCLAMNFRRRRIEREIKRIEVKFRGEKGQRRETRKSTVWAAYLAAFPLN